MFRRVLLPNARVLFNLSPSTDTLARNPFNYGNKTLEVREKAGKIDWGREGGRGWGG